MAPQSFSTGSLLRLDGLFLPRSTQSSHKMIKINTTTTIAPINRLMGLFTFVSSFSYPHFPKRARTCIQEHSAIKPSLVPLPNRLGQHKVGTLIKEPGLLFSSHLTSEFPRIGSAGSPVSENEPSRQPGE